MKELTEASLAAAIVELRRLVDHVPGAALPTKMVIPAPTCEHLDRTWPNWREELPAWFMGELG
jgi:hypothetical protein